MTQDSEDRETSEADLWFLPRPSDEPDLPPGAAPLPMADRRSLFDLAEWQAAQAAQSGDLVRMT